MIGNIRFTDNGCEDSLQDMLNDVRDFYRDNESLCADDWVNVKSGLMSRAEALIDKYDRDSFMADLVRAAVREIHRGVRANERYRRG
jgi:hypothetical protein